MTPVAAVAPLPAWDRFTAQLSERLNPIVVKEVRQGLRTRVFWIFFGLMLFACLCISLIAWAQAQEAGDDAGRYFFIAFFVCLSVVQFFIIPYTAYRSMAREREDETWVLLTLTGLGPRKILRGKLTSFLVQGALYGSAAGPFLLFCYYLNGIDLPTIGVCIVAGSAFQLFITSVAVCSATLAETRIARALMHFLLLGMLLLFFTWAIGSVVGVVSNAREVLSDNVFWTAAGFVVWAFVSYAVLLFEAAAARLSLSTESYALGPRLVFLAQLVVALGLAWWSWKRSGAEVEAVVPIEIFACLHLTFVGTFVMSDVDGMSRRHWTRTARFNLLKPGALRGFLLVLGCIVGVGAAFVAVFLSKGAAPSPELRVLCAAPAFVVLYLAAPTALARMVRHHPSQTPVMVRIFGLGLLLLASGVPPLVAVICGFDADNVLMNMLNPIIGLTNLGNDKSDWSAVLLVWGVAAAFTLLAFSLLLTRDVKPKEMPAT
jgi:ABC-type transport system involved in multi-copper enzyme maturation permease subunit